MASQQMAPHKVLVVIPTLNEAANIEKVLDQLREGLPASLPTTFVVCDGGSTDDTRAIVQRLRSSESRLQLLPNPQRLQSAAVNLAVRTHGTDCDVLVRCDAHAVYPPGFVASLVQSLDRSGADAVVVPMDTVGGSCFQNAVAWVSDSLIGSGGSAHRGGRRSGFVDHGHHAAFRIDRFLAAGGYDESFSHNEDAELDCRQRAIGSRIFLDADIRLQYFPRKSLASLGRQYFNYGRGRSRTVRRHPDSLRARQLAVPAFMGLSALAILLSPWMLWPLLAPAIYLAVLLLATFQQLVQRRSACALLYAPVAATMHGAWAAGFFGGMLSLKESRWRVPGSGPRVWLVDPSLFTGPYDGALTEGLVDAGVQPMWATRPTRSGDTQEIPQEYVDDFFYRRVDDASGLPAALRAVAKGGAHVLGMARLVWRVWRQRPDVVHFQWVVLPPIDLLVFRLVKRWSRVVLTAHDTVPINGEKVTFMQRVGFDAPLKEADAVVVHTQAGRRRLLELGLDAKRVEVIPHGPLRVRAEPSPGRGPRDPRWTFVLFGEMKWYKGLDLLVEAMGTWSPELRRQARVIVAGRPRIDLAPIEARIAELGLGAMFDIRPQRQSEAQMADLFDDADAFVFPYRNIDASGVYYLVKSLRKWIVATRIGVFAENLKDGEDGQLVDVERVDQLSEALKAAVLGRPVPGPASESDTWAGIGRTTRRLYERLMTGQVPGGEADLATGPRRFVD